MVAHHSVADEEWSWDGLLRHSGHGLVHDVLDVRDWGVCEPMLDGLHRFRRGLCLEMHPFFFDYCVGRFLRMAIC